MSKSDKLIISFKFPPDNDISGIVVAKRIINNNSKVDLLSNKHDGTDSIDFNIADEFINQRLCTSVDAKRDSVDCIFSFINQGLELIGDKQYNEIYSRSWYMSNHYLALEYKFAHPEVQWTAEFSDPVLRNIYGKNKNYKSSVFNDSDYIERLNSRIKTLGYSTLDCPANTFYMAEYLTFIFADEIIFTNPNQMQIMLENYDDDVRELVLEKSVIMSHPVLSEEHYHMRQSNIDINEDEINIAYFGTFYYTHRHFEALFYAYESLNHKYKDKIKFHLFIKQYDFLNILIENMDFKDNIIIRDSLDYLEFLNASTKFDILLLNDTITEGSFNVNPYLPSKLSDYMGSHRDIWAIYEDRSSLSELDFKYMSSMNDYKQSRDVLVNILSDYGYDDDYSVDDSYYERRITDLNRIVKKEYDSKVRLEKENRKLKRKIKRLKEENESILSSRSWKITKPLRNLKNK